MARAKVTILVPNNEALDVPTLNFKTLQSNIRLLNHMKPYAIKPHNQKDVQTSIKTAENALTSPTLSAACPAAPSPQISSNAEPCLDPSGFPWGLDETRSVFGDN